jgi:hypothetical protein
MGTAAVCAPDPHHRLDQEGRVGERRQVGADPYSPGAAVDMLELCAVLGDALLGAGRRLHRAAPEQHVSVPGTDSREPARDRAGPGAGESFLHVSPESDGRRAIPPSPCFLGCKAGTFGGVETPKVPR